MSREFCLIGHPLGHSMSGYIHGELFHLSGKEAAYRLWDIAPEELPRKRDELRRLSGFNVTIPHKIEVIGLLDRLDSKAELYHSVNTVKCGEECVGFNTDANGFLRALEAAGMPLGGRVVLCGAGGVARMMAFEAALAGSELTLAVRGADVPAAQGLCREITERLGREPRICLLDEVGGAIDLLINATPVGMYPNSGAMPVAEAALKNCRAVFDAIYNPEETLLMQTARRLGARASGGMTMLVWQAVVAHEIWDGVSYCAEEVEALVGRTNEEMRRRCSRA